jgi:hypothetical protein
MHDVLTPHARIHITQPPQHGTFKQHLLGVWKILTVWDQPQALARCGLFHSAYSNSYVNLAIFKAGVDRELVKEDCGAEAEDLIYKFCGARVCGNWIPPGMERARRCRVGL